MPDKVKKSYRLERGVADRISEIAEQEGTTETEALSRAVMAYGVDGVTRECAENEKTGGDEGSAALVSLLQANVEDLRAQVATLTEQMKVKDAQIEAANRHIDQAQALHAVTEATGAKMLERPDGESAESGRRGFWSRLFGNR